MILIADLIDEARAELGGRARRWPGLTAAGKLKLGRAKERVERMRAIVALLVLVHDDLELRHRLEADLARQALAAALDDTAPTAPEPERTRFAWQDRADM